MRRLFLFLSLSLVAASAVARQKVPVILVAGQSNADGRVPMADFPQDIVYKYCRWSYGKQSRQRSSKVVEALYRLQGEDDNFHVVDAADLSLLSDRLHFDARGALTLGHRVFDRMMRRSADVWPVTDPAVKKSLNGEWQ